MTEPENTNQAENPVVREMTGRIQYFKDTFGFICPDDPLVGDVFVHHSQIEPWQSGFKRLIKGQAVKFELVRNSRGLQAFNVVTLQERVAREITSAASLGGLEQ